MLGGGLCGEVVQYVEEWIPERKYRKEVKFQNDLQEYLDERLNESSGMGMGIATGNEHLPVKREHGNVNADVAVRNDVGIELKRDFKNTNKHRLSGQITDYKKEFPCVIVVACGISDMDGWRELQNDYAGMGGVGMNQTEVHFVYKEKEHFGKDSSEFRDEGGLLGGGGLF